jgi:hypothetical protein
VSAGRASRPARRSQRTSCNETWHLEITSELTENAVLFGDGIEADRLHLDWGQHLRIGLADRHFTLVR